MNGVKIGWSEILFVAAVLVIVFSASRMSALGNALGKFIYSFKKAQKGEGFVAGKHRLSGPVEEAEVVEDKKKKSHS
jgi:Sec-independent protein translocase protein TatA